MIDQNSQFQAILTAVGEAKQANADALGIPWTFAQMGVGDANGTDPFPDRLQTKLINERRKAPLNQLKPDPKNPGIIIAEQVIPETVGGFWIREIGLYDQDGDLVAVANCAPTFKPLLGQGSGRTQIIRMNLIVSSIANIVLKIDPAVVLATREYVDLSIDAVVPANKPAGSYRKVTISSRGIVTSGSNPTTLDGYEITDAIKKGQYGLGATDLIESASDVIGRPGGFYFFGESDNTFVQYASVLNLPYGASNSAQLAIRQGAAKASAAIRSVNAQGGWTGLAELWTDANFTPSTKADKATTLGGYGISDAYTKTQTDSAINSAISGKADKATTLVGYGISDAYTKSQTDSAINSATSGKADKATTLVGYGISDAYTKGQTDSAINSATSGKANKATTLGGYGITDAYTRTEVNSALGGKLDKSGGTIAGSIYVVSGQSLSAPALSINTDIAGNSLTLLRLLCPDSGVLLGHANGTSTLSVLTAAGGAATISAGEVLSAGSPCHTAASFMKPVAGQWISLTGGAMLPAGGTWAYQVLTFNNTGTLIAGSTAGLVPGGTQLGHATSIGFAWRVQ
ncbi:phage tail protein [Pseudomonas sp. MD332_8]|uniref:phage tail-collar fiber domain-containing protein n=1 Tax=unclassified Pseudomonas TaxID=196821 RepID=UPI0036D26057